MIIERPTKKTANFLDIDVGECFTHYTEVYIKIDELFDDYGTDGECFNAINLETGGPSYFSNYDTVYPMPTAKIIFTEN